jgi:mRNA interferase MazF
MMTCKRGDVAIVLFPHSDLRSASRRPCLVVQQDGIGTGLPQTIVAMITSNMARAGHPSRVEVSLATSQGLKTGLKTDSVIMLDNLATVHFSEVVNVIGDWRTWRQLMLPCDPRLVYDAAGPSISTLG